MPRRTLVIVASSLSKQPWAVASVFGFCGKSSACGANSIAASGSLPPELALSTPDAPGSPKSLRIGALP